MQETGQALSYWRGLWGARARQIETMLEPSLRRWRPGPRRVGGLAQGSPDWPRQRPPLLPTPTRGVRHIPGLSTSVPYRPCRRPQPTALPPPHMLPPLHPHFPREGYPCSTPARCHVCLCPGVPWGSSARPEPGPVLASVPTAHSLTTSLMSTSPQGISLKGSPSPTLPSPTPAGCCPLDPPPSPPAASSIKLSVAHSLLCPRDHPPGRGTGNPRLESGCG